jgi:O-antigen/teichoic acid export membrane protein
MSRAAKYFRALATGYGLLVVNSIYSLALIPLAISYVGTEVFGLWALTIQIGSLAQLVDAGMTGALTRILMDHKDDTSSPEYRQLFYTMFLVFALLGAFVAALVVICSPWLVSSLAIPEHLATDYRRFLCIYIISLGFWFSQKPISMLAYIHQRSDILNLISLFGLIAAFATVWMTLALGWGLWALLAGFVVSQILTNVVVVFANLTMGFFPKRQTGPKLSLKAFREVFSYGKDRFLLTLGLSCLQAAPTFLITRLLGLDASATWTVATRANQLCFVFITKLSDMSYPALAEMYVRGEKALLAKRQKQLMLTGLALAAFFAFGIATCNGAFVSLWTGGKISTFPLLDAAIACWLLCQTAQRFIFVPVSIARNLKGVRASYLYETLLFSAAGFLLLSLTSNLALVAAALCGASLVVTLPILFRKAAAIISSGIGGLLLPVWSISLRVVLPFALLVWAGSILPAPGSWLTLALKGATVALVGALLLLAHPGIRGIALDMCPRFIPLKHRKKIA